MSFVSWSYVPGRASEIAASLDGEAAVIYDGRLVGRRRVLARYLLSAIQTISYLVRRRPLAIIVTLPPVIPGLIVFAYSWLFSVPFALDSHPSAFGRKNDRWSRRLLPIHRWLARRAATTLVTTSEWIKVVGEWGGRGLIVHEAPPTWCSSAAVKHQPLRVLFVCVFSPDEPVDSVLDAVRGLEGVEMTITGDQRRARQGLVDSAPANVRFCGFLNQADYRRTLQETDAVLALTTEPTSVMRAAYEATYAERPLIASDNPAMRELFDDAILVQNDAQAIRQGLHEMIVSYDDLLSTAPRARARQLDRWERQLTELRSSLMFGSDTAT